MNNLNMYISGRSFQSDDLFSVICPANDLEVGSVFVANQDIAEQALQTAKEAERRWGTLPLGQRISWMKKLIDALIEHEDQLRLAVHMETGKPWTGTKEDFDSLVASLEFYSEEIKRYTPPVIADLDGTHLHTLKHKPLGVVVAYLSWNFPLLNLGFKLGPAMASGCPIILKPSLKAPLSAYLVGDICQKIGLPDGVVTVLAGDDNLVGNYLSSSTIPQMLTLIGSIATGVKVMQAGSSSIKRYSMELGGNTPFIVCQDAELDLAADILVALKFGNAGQICVAPNRVFVHRDVKKSFTNKVLQRTSNIKLGFSRTEEVDMGPVIDKPSRERIHNMVMDAVSNGADILCGGEIAQDKPGAFYPPTVIEGVTPNMAIYQEEIFGPVISMIEYESQSKMLEMVNATETGLASYVFSKDMNRSDDIAHQLEFGEVQINGVKYGIDLPHLGIKQSGVGCDCSRYALDDYFYLTRTTRAL